MSEKANEVIPMEHPRVGMRDVCKPCEIPVGPEGKWMIKVELAPMLVTDDGHMARGWLDTGEGTIMISRGLPYIMQTIAFIHESIHLAEQMELMPEMSEDNVDGLAHLLMQVLSGAGVIDVRPEDVQEMDDFWTRLDEQRNARASDVCEDGR